MSNTMRWEKAGFGTFRQYRTADGRFAAMPINPADYGHTGKTAWNLVVRDLATGAESCGDAFNTLAEAKAAAESYDADMAAAEAPAPVALPEPETTISIVRSSMGGCHVGEAVRFATPRGEAFVAHRQARNAWRLREAIAAAVQRVVLGSIDEVIARAFYPPAPPPPEAAPVVLDLRGGFVADPKYMADEPAPVPQGGFSDSEQAIIDELEQHQTISVRYDRPERPAFASLRARGLITSDHKDRGGIWYMVYRLVPLQKQVELQATEQAAHAAAHEANTMYRAWTASPTGTAVGMARGYEVRVTALASGGFRVLILGGEGVADKTRTFSFATDVHDYIKTECGGPVRGGWRPVPPEPVAEVVHPEPMPERAARVRTQPGKGPADGVSGWGKDMLTQAIHGHHLTQDETARVLTKAKTLAARDSTYVLVGHMQNAIDWVLGQRTAEPPTDALTVTPPACEVTYSANAASLMLTEANTMNISAQKAMLLEAHEQARFHNAGAVNEAIVMRAAHFARALVETGGLDDEGRVIAMPMAAAQPLRWDVPALVALMKEGAGMDVGTRVRLIAEAAKRAAYANGRVVNAEVVSTAAMAVRIDATEPEAENGR